MQLNTLAHTHLNRDAELKQSDILRTSINMYNVYFFITTSSIFRHVDLLLSCFVRMCIPLRREKRSKTMRHRKHSFDIVHLVIFTFSRGNDVHTRLF